MRERPILFSGPMVRAILASAKTQTRRVIRWPDWIDHNRDVFAADLGKGQHVGQFKDGRVVRSMVPAYAKGDRLWVREMWAPHPEDTQDPPEWVVFAADRGWWGCSDTSTLTTRRLGKLDDSHRDPRWRPSIFMPRWASRLTLDVIDVRVQRLQDISESDAEAEGIAYHPAAKAIIDSSMWTWTAAFAAGWNSINGKRPGCSWRDNPWVWAITFWRLP